MLSTTTSLNYLQFSDSHLKESIPSCFKVFQKRLINDIKKKNFIQEDKHLQRKTYSLPGHFVIITDELLRWLKRVKPITKYVEDWSRMTPSFFEAVKAARSDKNSRQLMVFNDDQYSIIKQCFTSFQFVYTKRKDFDLYVYQRSADMIKLKDDLIFFGNVAQVFGRATLTPINKIVVIYGHCHIETKK